MFTYFNIFYKLKGGNQLPLSKEDKKLLVQELIGEFKKSPSIVLTNYQGIDFFSLTELRNNLRKNNIKFKLYKNTLLNIAAKEVGLEKLTDNLSGGTAVAFSQEDTFLPIKLLHKYSLDNKDKLKLRIALLEGNIYLGDQLERIAFLPSKEELLAKMLGNIKSPISSTVFTLKSPLLGLVNALDQIHKQKIEQQI